LQDAIELAMLELCILPILPYAHNETQPTFKKVTKNNLLQSPKTNLQDAIELAMLELCILPILPYAHNETHNQHSKRLQKITCSKVPKPICKMQLNLPC
jgi:uncharacterized membrane protein (DUF4010 family)